MRAGAAEARRALCAEGAAGSPFVAIAGEHACREHQMTVHAAMESGERAAAQARGGPATPCDKRSAPCAADAVLTFPSGALCAQVLAALGRPQAFGQTGDLLLRVAAVESAAREARRRAAEEAAGGEAIPEGQLLAKL